MKLISRNSVMVVVMLIVLAAAPAWADPVINLGDSWSAFGHDQLANKFPAGINISNFGFPGATAQAFASDPVGINWVNSALAANPDAQYMYLSVGGNDLLFQYSVGNGANAAAIIDTYTRMLIDNILAQRPALQIVLPGYDFPNFEKEVACIAEGFLVFGTPLALTINPIFLACIRDVQANIAASYSNVTAVDAFYTLQIAGGTPGAPNPLMPSPASLMGGDGDCIHANSQGYNHFTGAIYDAYFLPIYGAGGCMVMQSSNAADSGMVLVLIGLLCLGTVTGFVFFARRRQR
ncbi:SGNH/GDSL hydrolase family protein [Thermodesulfobacteriota bacterium]